MARKKKISGDLFEGAAKTTARAKPQKNSYTAQDIEVLEGLEPVRRRPGMYIGGTDLHALHHLFSEIIDNAMDEAVAGHASFIEVHVEKDNWLCIRDNGRGIPVDPHPKFKDKSALEIIMTTLHAGGKFGGEAYTTSGGLHGVGVSVVNALSDHLHVRVMRDAKIYEQRFSCGHAQNKLKQTGTVKNKRGTEIRFHPDPKIFGKIRFDPERLYAMTKAKAYLFAGVEIRWICDESLIKKEETCPAQDTLKFPNGLEDYLKEKIGTRPAVTPTPFAGHVKKPGGHGTVEWAVSWTGTNEALRASYCNTVPTPEGGTHEQGLRNALTKGVRAYGDLTNNKKTTLITADDVMGTCVALVSVFIREPEFQGQTKDKLSSPEAIRIVEQALRDHFEHWLTANPQDSDKLLSWIIERAEERMRRKQERDINRKSAIRKLRLPGKLADCTQSSAQGTELFIVEGDSAGGSAKQARNRANQAILPLRGKILNVANATTNKIKDNQLLADLVQALGCGTGTHYNGSRLRYEKVIIMTDADVDGAHIASLLITFFHEEMPELIHNGHLFLAVPPLYRLAQGGKTLYARDDADRDALLEAEFRANAKVDISRFKGLGEMRPDQLKETTMLPEKRTLLNVTIAQDDIENTAGSVKNLMGNKPELRFKFIQENAAFVEAVDI